jgi:hypothetical protein
MLDHIARTRGLASLAIAACLMVVVAGCSSGGSGAKTAVQPTAGSTHVFVTYTSPSKAQLPWQRGLTGTHPGGGGPQE